MKVIGKKMAFVILGISLLTLIGCSNESSADGDVTLTFWTHNNGPMVEQTEKLIDKFEEENPEITIDYQAMPNDQFAEKTTVSLGTQTGPDVFLISDRNIPSYTSKGVLEPVSPSAFGFENLEELKGEWISGSLDGLMYEDDIYGIPMEFNSFNLFINNKAFEKAGLNPETDAPETWDELMEVASKLTIRENGKLVQAGFDWPMFNGGWEALIIDPMVRQLGGKLVDDYGTKAYFESQEVQTVLQTWQDLYYKHDVMDIGFGTHSPATPNQSFIDGQLAMWISGPWAIPMITEESAVYDNYSVVPLPSFDENNPVTTLYSWNWAVNSETEHPEESWEFINFLSNHQKEWLSNAGYIQPRKGWLDDQEVQEFPFLDVWIQGMENGHYILRSEKYSEIVDELGKAVDQVMKEERDVKEALEEAQPKIEDLFN